MADTYLEGLLASNKSPAEKLIDALRLHIGDDDSDEGFEFHDEELYLFIRDANRLLSSLNVSTSLTFSDTSINVTAGTVTDAKAIQLIFGADYLMWRRLEREGTRNAVSIREMDTAIDTREIARSSNAGLRFRWEQLMKVVKEVKGGTITPWRINTYVQREFPSASQTYVDETRSNSARRV